MEFIVLKYVSLSQVYCQLQIPDCSSAEYQPVGNFGSTSSWLHWGLCHGPQCPAG